MDMEVTAMYLTMEVTVMGQAQAERETVVFVSYFFTIMYMCPY